MLVIRISLGFAEIKKANLKPGKNNIIIEILSDGKIIDVVNTGFVAPEKND